MEAGVRMRQIQGQHFRLLKHAVVLAQQVERLPAVHRIGDAGTDRVAVIAAGVRLAAGVDVDAEDILAAGVDLGEELRVLLAEGAVVAVAVDGIDDDIRIVQRGIDLLLLQQATGRQFVIRSQGLLGDRRAFAGIDADGISGRRQQARQHEAVAAVVAFAAQHQGLRIRWHFLRQRIKNRRSRFFHQAGGAEAGTLFDFPHSFTVCDHRFPSLLS